ncbi:MAG: hypothetical protein GXY44_08255 [Phycisphaerales bacterium]|nr:hypothetical protein [Phycisphaerales bacterium]
MPVRPTKAMRLAPLFGGLLLLLMSSTETALGESLTDQLQAIHQSADNARQLLSFEEVETLRNQRNMMLGMAAGNPAGLSQDEKSWIEDYQAYNQAEELIQHLQYNQAYELCHKRWQRFAAIKPGNTPAYGDLVMKMAEAAMASMVIHEEPIVPFAELKNALIEAVDRDPCQVEAQVVLAYLERPEPREAFTRAEVRSSLTNRNQRLLNLSYNFAKAGLDKDMGTGGYGQPPARTPGSAQDNPDAPPPIMPWHAPVELLKAESMAFVLHDTLYTQAFLAGERLEGIDSRGARFVLLPEGIYIEDYDRRGRPGWALLSPELKGRRITWRKYSIYVLRDASAATLEKLTDALGKGQKAGAAGRPASYGTTNQPRKEQSPQEQISSLLAQLDTSAPIWTEYDDISLYGIETLSLDDLLLITDRLGLKSQQFLKRELAKLSRTSRPRDTRTDRSRGRGDSGGATGSSSEDEIQLSISDRQIVHNLTSFSQGSGGSAGGSRSARDSRNPQDTQLTIKGLCLVLCDPTSYKPHFLYDQERPYLQLSTGPRLYFDEPTQSFTTDDGAVTLVHCFSPAFLPTPILRNLLDKTTRGAANDQRLQRLMDALEETRHDPSREKVVESRVLQAADSLLDMELPGRFLIEGRGNYILNAADLPAAGTALGMNTYGRMGSASMAGFGDYAMIDGRTGRIIDDQDVRYTVQDYSDMATNIAGVFMPRTYYLRPCVPVYKAYELFGDRFGLQDAQIEQLLSGLNRSRPPSAGYYGQPQAQEAPTSEQDLRRLAGDPSQWPTLLHRQAQYDFSQGRYHRAMLNYRDLLDHLGSENALEDSFFIEVPNRERIDQFAGQLSAYITSLYASIKMESELAALLDQVHLQESGHFLRRRMVDRFELYTLPVIEEAIAYAQSYGFSPPAQLTQTQQELMRLIQSIQQLVGRQDDTPAFVSEAFKATSTPNVQRGVKFVLQTGEARDAASETDSAEQEIEQQDEEERQTRYLFTVLDEVFSGELSLASWMELKSGLAKKASGLLWRSRQAEESVARRVAVNLVPVRKYDEDKGLNGDVSSMITQETFSAMRKWAARSAEKRLTDPHAGEYLFILAWYWLDRGQWHHAREAYIHAARVYQDQVKQMVGGNVSGGNIQQTLAELIAKRNALIMLIAAAGITHDTPPGAMTMGAAYVTEIQKLALMWKRRWNSAGLPQYHAARQGEMLDLRISMIMAPQAELQDPLRRYFWFDYDAYPSVLLQAGAALAIGEPDSESQ